jgi:hypothetical protein
MSNDRDPILDAMFEKSRPTYEDDGYVERVMAKVDGRRRNVMFGRLLIVALIFLLEFLPSSPLQNSVGRITEALGNDLVELNAGWLEFIFAPVNSIAGIIGLFLLGLHVLYRRNVR